jgi:hypothetical protein
MARRLLTVLSLLCCALLATSVDAGAATKKKVVPAPTVTSIVPMKAQVGEKLTVNGKNFVKGTKTKVYFLRDGGGVAWVSADSATTTRLIVTVPEKLIPLLRGTPDARKATKFQIRLLGKRFGAATRIAKSPVFTAPNAVAPGENPTAQDPGGPTTPPDGDCDGDGVKNSVDPDDDNDALSDDLEVLPAHTDPCRADTDGDKIADGFEYYSARDLNVALDVPAPPYPYPGKKPWPNPLDSTDALVDHDGDGLTMTDEYLLWKYSGNLSVPLNYSAGLQKSVEHMPAPTADQLAERDLSDDERDGDVDGLTNYDETHGGMLQDWWDAFYDGQNGRLKETRYPNTFPGVSAFDPDSDGDGKIDGEDDQDHDGLSNAFEVKRPGNWLLTYTSVGEYPFGAGQNPWSRTQPYNPCKPVQSATCHLHEPLGYYQPGEAWGGVKRAVAGPQPTTP